MEKIKMYEPVTFALDVWDGIVENKTYAVYEDEGSSYLVIDLMGKSERIYKCNIVSTQCCTLDANVVQSMRELCIAMNLRSNLDKAYLQKKKDSDNTIAERKHSLAVATGLMTREQFEEALSVALDKKYGGDISVKVVSNFNNVATLHIMDSRLVRKYPTLDEFAFLSASYGPKKFHINKDSRDYHAFAQENAPDEKDFLSYLSCGTIVGANINASGGLVAFRRYTINLDAGMTVASINRIVTEAAVVVI
jgi:hypothetical protein